MALFARLRLKEFANKTGFFGFGQANRDAAHEVLDDYEKVVKDNKTLEAKLATNHQELKRVKDELAKEKLNTVNNSLAVKNLASTVEKYNSLLDSYNEAKRAVMTNQAEVSNLKHQINSMTKQYNDTKQAHDEEYADHSETAYYSDLAVGYERADNANLQRELEDKTNLANDSFVKIGNLSSRLEDAEANAKRLQEEVSRQLEERKSLESDVERAIQLALEANSQLADMKNSLKALVNN